MTHTRIAIALAASIILAGCGTMRMYDQDTPLEFQDFDYTFTTETATVNGVAVAFHDTKGAGVPVVLIHGLASNAGFWRYNVGALEKSGLRVIAVDLPGYGKSGKPFGAPYSMHFYAETITALLKQLGLQRAVWVGHSMGAQISMTAALQFPAFVDRLVLLSPAGFEAFKEGEGNWMRNAVSPDFVRKTPEDRARANLVSNFYSWNDAWEWMVEERVRMAKARDFDRFCYTVWRCVGAMLDEPVWKKLPQITMPTLVIASENDNLIPNPYLHGGFTRDVMEKGAASLGNAQLRVLPRSGHMVQIEKSADVNRLIAEFVNR